MITTPPMNTEARSSFLSYLSLFTSLGTLLCCALPSLLVLIGLGASVASMLSFLPWLVTLSRHKSWTFAISALLIAMGFVNIYYIVPRVKTNRACDPNDPSCDDAGRVSKIVLWASLGIYAVGFFVAYGLGPIFRMLDQ